MKPVEAVVRPPLQVLASQRPLADAEGDLPEALARRIDFAWSGAMAGSLLFVILLLSLSGGVAVPVLLAVAMAYGLNPAATFLQRRGFSRPLATGITLAAVGLLLTSIVLYLIPVFRDEARKLPDFFRQASIELIPRLEQSLGVSLPELVRNRTAELGHDASDLISSAGPAAANLAARFAGDTARFLAMALGLLVVPVLGFFFLRDYPDLVERAQSLIPRRAVHLVSHRFAEVDEVLSAFVRGQLTVGAILAVIYSTGLSLARIDMAIVIGCFAGFGMLVPYVGPGIGFVLAMISMLLSWQGSWQLAVILGTFAFAQSMESLLLTPRIVGHKVGLPPVAVIIAVLSFGEIFGFVGVLVAVPTSAILKVVLKVVIHRYRRTRLYTGDPASS